MPTLTFTAEPLIRSRRAASRPWSGLTSITCFEPATIGCSVRTASSACRMESIVTSASASSRPDSGALLPARLGELR